MQFRLHYFRHGDKQIDLLLAPGKFYIGRAPNERPQLLLDEPFLQKTHLLVEINHTEWQVSRGALDPIEDRQRIPDETRLQAAEDADDKDLSSLVQPVKLGAQTRVTIARKDGAAHPIILYFERVADDLASAPQPTQTEANTRSSQALNDLFCKESQSRRLLKLLPEIYQPANESDTFLARYLRIFEAILLPLEWNVEHFALFLDPVTAPLEFLPWLEEWFRLDGEWDEERRRLLLKNAPEIFLWRGTAHGLRLLLAICLYGEEYQWRQYTIDIDDASQSENFKFSVKAPHVDEEATAEGLNLADPKMLKSSIMKVIDSYKPLHTTAEFDWK